MGNLKIQTQIGYYTSFNGCYKCIQAPDGNLVEVKLEIPGQRRTAKLADKQLVQFRRMLDMAKESDYGPVTSVEIVRDISDPGERT